MSMECNIDSRGRKVRLIWGLLMILGAVLVAALWAAPDGGWGPWSVVGFLGLAGVAGIYEARRGWCVVRAMGWKTPI